MGDKSATHDKHGHFLPGVVQKSPRKKTYPPIQCPQALKHVEGAWQTLVTNARKDSKAAVELIKLASEYSSDLKSRTIDPKDAELYTNLPLETSELLWLLDVSLASTLNRFEKGLPCSDTECLIALTAKAVKDDTTEGPKAAAPIERWRGVTIALIDRLRKEGKVPK